MAFVGTVFAQENTTFGGLFLSTVGTEAFTSSFFFFGSSVVDGVFFLVFLVLCDFFPLLELKSKKVAHGLNK